MERRPRVLVDLGLERGLQRPVGIVGAEEIGVADEEALLVVVGVDEPARDAVGAIAANLARAGVEDVHAVHFHPHAPGVGGQEGDVGLAEDDEEVPLARVLEVVGHVQVGVHARLEHGDAPELAELRGVRVVVEGARDEHVETGVARLARGGNQVGAGDRAELRPDEDRGPPLDGRRAVAFHVAPLGRDQLARPRRERGEDDARVLVRLLHARRLEVLEDHLRKRLPRGVLGVAFRELIDQLVVLVHAEHAVRREALDRERSRDADLPVVRIRLVVEVLELRLGRDGGVDLVLPRDACLPPITVDRLRDVGPLRFGLARDLPLLPLLLQRGIQLFAQGLQPRLPLLPDDVDLGVVGDRLERDVGHALVDEPLTDVAVRRPRRRRGACDLGFLELTIARVREQVVGIARAHDTGAGQRERDARGVDGDPAATPLLGDGGGGAGAAGRIEDEVAGIRGEE